MKVLLIILAILLFILGAFAGKFIPSPYYLVYSGVLGVTAGILWQISQDY